MNLIVAFCLLCGWVAPHACRTVDVRDPPSEDLEPFVAHHHHEGNIAELLIPLLERSLAQSEARSNERQHRRNKPGKKVIQVLPYRGSEEHKRKGWRKMNSHKKQVVEITPLHGKNKAKPLAYILSAAKPNHGEHVKNDLENDKSTSEEQLTSEENKEDSEDVSTRREGDLNSPSASSDYENVNSRQTKDLSSSDSDYSADVTVESTAEVNADKSETNRKVIIEESEEERTVTFGKKHAHSIHGHKSGRLRSAKYKAVTLEDDEVTAEDAGVTAEDTALTAEDKALTAEDRALAAEDRALTAEDRDLTAEDRALTAEDRALTAEIRALTAEDRDLTAEDRDLTAEDRDLTAEGKALTAEDRALTAEDRALTAEDIAVTAEDRALTAEDKALTAEDTALTAEDGALTAEDKALTAEDTALTAEDGALTAEDRDLTAEDKALTAVDRDLTAEDRVLTAEDRALTLEDAVTDERNDIDVTVENADVTAENDVTVERRAVGRSNTHVKHAHRRTLVHPHHVEHDIQENEDSSDFSRSGLIENDIVIGRGRDQDSAEKSISKLFNARARDIIELIQSSAEASTTAHGDCLEAPEKHHDHKSYRLSFLFNK